LARSGRPPLAVIRCHSKPGRPDRANASPLCAPPCPPRPLRTVRKAVVRTLAIQTDTLLSDPDVVYGGPPLRRCSAAGALGASGPRTQGPRMFPRPPGHWPRSSRPPQQADPLRWWSPSKRAGWCSTPSSEWRVSQAGQRRSLDHVCRKCCVAGARRAGPPPAICLRRREQWRTGRFDDQQRSAPVSGVLDMHAKRLVEFAHVVSASAEAQGCDRSRRRRRQPHRWPGG
jgi:hypothetical protein